MFEKKEVKIQVMNKTAKKTAGRAAQKKLARATYFRTIKKEKAKYQYIVRNNLSLVRNVGWHGCRWEVGW